MVTRISRLVAQEALIVGAALAVVLLSRPTGFAFSLPAALIACALLPLRLRWPWLSMIACLVGLSGELGLAPAVFGLYQIGRTTQSRPARLTWLAAAVAAPQLTVLLTEHLAFRDATLSVLFSLLSSVAPLAAGALITTRVKLTASLAGLRQAREAELEARGDQARAEERSRIAQEIHDAVGHHATLIAVEAAALSATAPDQDTKQAATRIRELAKESLTEMRTALGLANNAPAPEPGNDLRDVPDLIGKVRQAGLRVEFTDEAAPEELSPPVGRAVFRIVQESLTNAAKHAPGASVSVRLTKEATQFTVSVTSGPAATPRETWSTGGLGVAGMIERARTVGGDLQVERGVGGVFTVRARLPLPGYPTPTKVGTTGSTIGGTEVARDAR
jgi:signal transduction histidine kinase